MTEPAEQTASEITVQPATASDLPYVLKTWGMTYEAALESAPVPGHVGNALRACGIDLDAAAKVSLSLKMQLGHPKIADDFLHDFAPIQAAIIKRSKVLTAVRDGRVLGFVVYEASGILHWLNVRKEHRRQGIAKRLIEAACITRPIVTAWTADLRHIGLGSATYKPFWLRTA